MAEELETQDWLVLFISLCFENQSYSFVEICLILLKIYSFLFIYHFFQSAGDSSMSSGSLGDRRSDSPDLRSLSPGGIYQSIGHLQYYMMR